MAGEADGESNLRQMAVGAVIAGGVAVAVLIALTTLNLGSGLIQSLVAITLGVVAAQLYERR